MEETEDMIMMVTMVMIMMMMAMAIMMMEMEMEMEEITMVEMVSDSSVFYSHVLLIIHRAF